MKHIYILMISEDTLTTVAHVEVDMFLELAKKVIRNFLDQYGHDEQNIELVAEGYAKIHRVAVDGSELGISIWDYAFDGNESLEDAMQRAKEEIEAFLVSDTN